jgi:hypothetical protein
MKVQIVQPVEPMLPGIEDRVYCSGDRIQAKEPALEIRDPCRAIGTEFEPIGLATVVGQHIEPTVLINPENPAKGNIHHMEITLSVKSRAL